MSINTGIQNEIALECSLNGRKFADLNSNLQAFIRDVFYPTAKECATDIIHARRTSNSDYKPDLIIEFAGRQANVSVKIGNGNSVHQEPIGVFVKYIADVLYATPAEIQALLFFHWGDGTLDGSAPVKQRMPAKEIAEKYPRVIATVQQFFDQHQDELLKRFLSTGVASVSHVDWIYYGDCYSGDWCKIDGIYAHLKSISGRAPSVGGLSFQTYGRSLEGKDDKRRDSIQLKWGNMASFFQVGSKTNPQAKIG